jgi:signal transduction histidine kinase
MDPESAKTSWAGFPLLKGVAWMGWLMALIGFSANLCADSGPTEREMLPLLTNVSEVCQLGDQKLYLNCSAHLEGNVLWASTTRDQFILQDDSGAAALVRINPPGQILQPGQRLAIAGKCVIERDRLRLGDQLVVDNDGLHTMTEKSGQIYLTAGKHVIRVAWFNRDMPSGLEVYYEGPNLPRQRVPDSALFYEETVSADGAAHWLNGLNYRCYEGRWSRTPSSTRSGLSKQGTVDNFDVNVVSRPADVGLDFSGYLEVPSDGLYTFTTISDDGSLMFIQQQAPQIEIIGTSSPSAPLPIATSQLLRQGQKDRWSQVEGTVTFVSDGRGALALELSSTMGAVHLDVANDQDGLSSRLLLNSRVRAIGICKSTLTTDGQSVAGRLLVPTLDQIEILQPNPTLWRDCPVVSNGFLNAANFSDANDSLVHVRGKIRSLQPGEPVLLEDGTGRVQVKSTRLPPGDVGREVEALGMWTRVGTNVVLYDAFYRELAHSEHTLPLLTTIEEIKSLSHGEAKQGYPVKIRGVITSLPSDGFTIQDATAATYVATNDSQLSAIPCIGDYWEVEGTTYAYFAPTILARRAVQLGPGILPEPIRPTWDQLINGSLDDRYVEIQGVVIAASSDGMVMLTHDGEITVGMLNAQPTTGKKYENALIAVRGCLVPEENILSHQVALGHVHLSDWSVSVVEPAPADPFFTPLKHVSDLLLFDPHADNLRLTKAAGQILHEQDGEFFLQDGVNGLRFMPRTSLHLQVGDFVEVVGYPDVSGTSPVLRESLVCCTGHAPLLTPQVLPVGSLSSAYQAVLSGGDWVDQVSATVTLVNLAVGHTYAVQFWVNDSRAASNRFETVTSGSNGVKLEHNSTDNVGGVGQYTIATFEADDTTQRFTLNGNASSQLNAIQLRDVTGFSRASAGITFAPAANISGDSDVFTNGTLLAAYDLSGVTASVHGVTFTGSSDTTGLGDHIRLSGFTGGNYIGFGSEAAPFGSLLGHYDATLVRVQARLISLSTSPSGQLLILDTGKQGFVGRLDVRDGHQANLLPGSKLELTGVYTSHGVEPAWAGAASSFELLLNSPADIAVLDQPAWWTLQRLLTVVGALVAVLIGALLWVVSLKRRVNAQAVIIRQKVENEATLQERARIAREIHDTLEQFLASANLQLSALASSLRDIPEESLQILEMTRSMVRHGQEEARRTVRNLRLLALEEHDLPTALNQVVAQFKNGSRTDIQVCATGVPRRLSNQVESCLLRIGQEAITNAIKHANARVIRLELDYGEAGVRLIVRDDGCGFDTARAASTEAGHFGLLGMRERAEKIGGALQILSTPGRGTSIDVEVPMPQSASAQVRSDSIST